MTFLSRAYSTSDGVATSYVFSYPYLLPAHIYVLTKAVGAAVWTELVQGVDWEFTSSNTIHFLTGARPVGTDILIRRSTPNADLIDRLTAPSTISASELNTISTQLLYLIQEALDAGISFEGNAIGDLFDSFITDARLRYDYHLSGTGLYTVGGVVGPVVVRQAATLPSGASGSRGSVMANPAGACALNIVRLRAGVETIVGTIGITTLGAVAVTVPSSTPFLEGDLMFLRTTTAGGLSSAAFVLSLTLT